MPACRGVSDPTGGLSHTNVLSEGLPMVLKARLPGQELQSVRNIHDCTRLPCEGMLNAHGSEGPCSVALRWRDSREPFFNCQRARSPMQGIFPSSSELNICRYMSISLALRLNGMLAMCNLKGSLFGFWPIVPFKFRLEHDISIW